MPPVQEVLGQIKTRKQKVPQVDLLITTSVGYSMVYSDITDSMFQDFKMLPLVKKTQDIATACEIINLQPTSMLKKSQTKVQPSESASQNPKSRLDSNMQHETTQDLISPRTALVEDKSDEDKTSILLGLYSN